MKRPTPLSGLFACAVALGSGLAQAEPDSSVNVGFGGMPRLMAHCEANVYTVEYEHAYSPTGTVLLRGSGVNYWFDSAAYKENGQIRGVDLGARHYGAGGMEGFFTGIALGYWKADWAFTNLTGSAITSQGTSVSHSVRLNIEIGDRIVIGHSNFSLMPLVNIGKFFSSVSCNYAAPAAVVGTPCNQKSEVDAYVFIGLTAGLAF